MPHRKLSEILRGQELIHVTSQTKVVTAAQRMTGHNVAAVLVIDDGEMVGIFTERDSLRRVVAVERNPADTLIGDVMTKDVVTLHGAQLGFEAVRMMKELSVRHIAVTGLDGSGYGIVSIRDFAMTELATFERELDFEGHVWQSI